MTGRGIHSVTQYTAITRITKAQLASEVPMWKRRGQRATGARRVSQVLQNLRITEILLFIIFFSEEPHSELEKTLQNRFTIDGDSFRWD